jgi:hypothetical protein
MPKKKSKKTSETREFVSSSLDTSEEKKVAGASKKKQVNKKKKVVKKTIKKSTKAIKRTKPKKKIIKKIVPIPVEIEEDLIDELDGDIEQEEDFIDTDADESDVDVDIVDELDDPDKEEEEEEEEEEEDVQPVDEVPTKVGEVVEKTAKNSLEKIDEQLAEIYKNKDGSIPDMTHFQVKKRHRFFRAFFLFLFTCIFLGAITWIGFFVLQPQTSFLEENVVLSISGEETVTLGEEIRYRLRYRNAQDVILSKATLQLRYPDGFVFKESSVEPLTDSNDTWALGTIGNDDSGYIDIYGTLYGDVGEDQSFRAFLNYFPSNFSSEFQKVATANIQVKDSPVTITVEGADTIIPGVETTLDIVVRPLQENDAVSISSLAVEIEPGDLFIKKSDTLQSDQFHDYRWSINMDEEEINIQVTGVFIVEDSEETVSLPIRLIGWVDENREGDGYVYASEAYEAVIVRQRISVTPVVNGATTNLTVQPGEILNTTMVVRNNGEAPLKQVEVRAVFDAPSFNRKSILFWSELFDEADGGIVGEQIDETLRRGTITWDSGDVPGLKEIAPGEEVTIDVRLPIKSDEEITLTDFTTHNITLVAEARYTLDDTQELLSSSPVEMMLNSDLSLNIRDEVEETEDGKEGHTIIWLLENTFHDLVNISLSADIYGDTSFDPEQLVTPAGEATYDPDTGKLVWSIENMPTSVDILPLQFVLTRNDDNPSQSQLVSKVTLHATDSVTGESMILVGDEILLGVPQVE